MNLLHKSILGLFAKCIMEVENLHEFTKDFRRIEELSFMTMGITKKKISLPHVDKNDIDASYITCFLDSKFLNLVPYFSYQH